MPGVNNLGKAAGIRVLIADRQSLFRASLRVLVENEPDMEVVGEEDDGMGVVQTASASKANVILMGLDMENADAFQVLSDLREKAISAAALVLPTEEELGHLPRMENLGVRGVVPRYAGSATLLRAIRKLHQGERCLELPRRGHRPAQSLTPAKQKRREPTTPSRHQGLTPREREIVTLVKSGTRYKQIARDLNISDQTVKNHLRNIFDKLGVKDRVQLAIYALNNDF